MVGAKILDSCREFINMLSKAENLKPLGFIPKDDEIPLIEGEDDIMEVLDEFISKIATMLVSLLEGEQDLEILQKMSFSLSVEDLKERLVNVFGLFLHRLKLYPLNKLSEGQTPENTPLINISKANDSNCLASVSLNKIQLRLTRDSFEDNIKEAFEIYVLLMNLAEGISSCAAYTQKEFFTVD